MRQQSSRASLFLIELIIAVLFFSLGSAVCVQAFVKAHLTSREARDLAFASSTVSSAANVVRYSGGTLEGFQAGYPEAFADGEGFAVCYDSELTPCAAEDAAYTLHVDTREEAGVAYADIRMTDAADSELFALALHWPAEGGAR